MFRRYSPRSDYKKEFEIKYFVVSSLKFVSSHFQANETSKRFGPFTPINHAHGRVIFAGWAWAKMGLDSPSVKTREKVHLVFPYSTCNFLLWNLIGMMAN